MPVGFIMPVLKEIGKAVIAGAVGSALSGNDKNKGDRGPGPGQGGGNAASVAPTDSGARILEALRGHAKADVTIPGLEEGTKGADLSPEEDPPEEKEEEKKDDV
jgi:hypothetical protein